MKIITSINIYNFHLVISYLGKGIDIIPFEDLRSNFRKISGNYIAKIDTETTITEITPFSHHLIGIENFKVKNFSLKNQYSNSSEDISASQISFDFNSNLLFILDEENVIQEVEVKHIDNLFVKNKFGTKSLEKFDSASVSNMKNYSDEIFLSIRGFGVCSINRDYNEYTYRTEDAQDVLLTGENKIIVVADFEGILLFRVLENKPFQKIKLYNNDLPQEIKLFNQKLIIKGKNGLYIYDFKTSNMTQIWNEKVGAFATYYDMIFFSSNNKMHMISNSNNSTEYFKMKNSVDIEVQKYFR